MTVASPCTHNLMDSAHPQTVLSKLNEQRSQGLFCDVTIVVEDVKFRAHKNILAACSGYFKNALTSQDTWSSSQVLELMDLKSEVFATILNFIYCSKVNPAGVEDTRGLVAAGKRLGIPFLEKLDECVRSTDYNAATVPKKTKKEAPKQEEMDGTTGPRITNAFSINEVCPGNNLFTPLTQTNGERTSPEVGQLPSGCSLITCHSGNNETTQALSEHSYAVSKSTETKENNQWDSKKVCKPAMSQMLASRNTGPLKKRHRLRGMLGRSLLPAPAEPQTDPPKSPTSADGLSSASAATPPSLFSESQSPIQTELHKDTDDTQMELGPPPLSPHPDESISIYGCEHCPEIFTNKALLTIHSEVHQKRFMTHLFCKFCHRKFIHLKRLRNHEQVCPKAAKGLPNLDATDMPTKETLPSGDIPNIESIMTQLPSVHPSPPITQSDPLPLDQSESLPQDQPEHPRDEKVVRPGGGQRRYHCSVCKRVYVTLSSLKRHENVHSWQRAYPCHYCNKVFALAEYRTKHEIWHTGERRYQCIFCLETFMTYYILKNHQKSFHGIDPSLAVRKKSANGGLKASVYPIKLYRLLPMKFRKRQYKTYSHTYSESGEKEEQAPLESSSLIPPFEESGLPDSVSLPPTFMATTKMVAPVMPRISFDKPCDQGAELSVNRELEIQKVPRNESKSQEAVFMNSDSTFSVQAETAPPSVAYPDDPESLGHCMPFFNSLNTVKKLGELSASAKRVEDMTKEILQSSTESLLRDKQVGAKIETYIAKPVCPGPSVDGSTMPLCQITVRIGNEAIIRRRIKGSKLFPRKKRKIREENEEGRSSQCSEIRENSESPRLRLRPEVATAKREMYDEPNDLDKADMLWRPYYSYKAKKKRKKLRLKQRKALFYPETLLDRSATSVDRSTLSDSTEVKRRNSSPRAVYNCDICDSSFITETGLRAHVIGSHPCFCRTCGKQGPPGEVPAGGDYVCNSCMENGSCFDNSPRSPNPEKKYRCAFCPQRFLYLATKRSHERKHQETNEEGYHSDNPTASSKYSKEDTIKSEDGDNPGGAVIKSEQVEDGHFSLDKFKTKKEDTDDFMSLYAYHDMPYSNCKSTLSANTEPVFSLTPSKVKHKIQKKKMHSSVHLISKKPAVDRESSRDGLRKNIQNEKSGKLFKTNDSEGKTAHISIHKPQKWAYKEEPFF